MSITNDLNQESSPKGVELRFLMAQKGAQTVLASGGTIPLQNVPSNLKQVLQAIGTNLVPYQAVHDARTALKLALQHRSEFEPAAKKFLTELQAAVVAAYGLGSTEFQAFGFKVRKTATPLTSEQKAQKADRMRRTRKARNVLGKKQRKSVTGASSSPTTTPATPASSGTTIPGNQASQGPTATNGPTTR